MGLVQSPSNRRGHLPGPFDANDQFMQCAFPIFLLISLFSLLACSLLVKKLSARVNHRRILASVKVFAFWGGIKVKKAGTGIGTTRFIKQLIAKGYADGLTRNDCATLR